MLLPLCTLPQNLAPVRRAGYVEQFDTLLAELSVREMLMYTAELKRPVQARPKRCAPRSACHPFWERLLDETHLHMC